MSYQALDFYDVDGQLSEEEILIRDSIREFVTDKVMPIIE